MFLRTTLLLIAKAYMMMRKSSTAIRQTSLLKEITFQIGERKLIVFKIKVLRLISKAFISIEEEIMLNRKALLSISNAFISKENQLLLISKASI